MNITFKAHETVADQTLANVCDADNFTSQLRAKLICNLDGSLSWDLAPRDEIARKRRIKL